MDHVRYSSGVQVVEVGAERAYGILLHIMLVVVEVVRLHVMVIM
jgi:hypothetical protein